VDSARKKQELKSEKDPFPFSFFLLTFDGGEGEVIMSRLQLAIEQIIFARNYTIGLLDQTPTAEWFRQPPGGVSHVGWQVAYPSAEIRSVLDKVHEQVLRELPGLDEASLDQPVPHPHPFAKTKLLALLWCAHHEMLHAGQIGLLRRHLGYPPMW
jgi:hypothetical protein